MGNQASAAAGLQGLTAQPQKTQRPRPPENAPVSGDVFLSVFLRPDGHTCNAAQMTGPLPVCRFPPHVTGISGRAASPAFSALPAAFLPLPVFGRERFVFYQLTFLFYQKLCGSASACCRQHLLCGLPCRSARNQRKKIPARRNHAGARRPSVLFIFCVSAPTAPTGCGHRRGQSTRSVPDARAAHPKANRNRSFR